MKKITYTYHQVHYGPSETSTLWRIIAMDEKNTIQYETKVKTEQDAIDYINKKLGNNEADTATTN